jgi:putative protease
MFGTRQKEDVTAAQTALSALEKLYAAQPAKYPVQFSFVCRADEAVALTAESGAHIVTVRGEKPAKAVNRAVGEADVTKQLQKCGGTLFYPEKVQIEMDGGLFLPASAVNALRRDALDGLVQKIAETPKRTCTHYEESQTVHKADGMRMYARFADETQIPEGFHADKLILPLYCGAETIASHGAAVEIPRGLFGREDEVRKKLTACRESGVREAVFASLDGLALAKACGLVPIAGFGSNLFNTLSLREMETRGVRAALVSPELPLRCVRELGADIPRGVFLYGRLPLMLTRNCPQKNGKSCSACQRRGELTDRKGVTFPIECRSGCAEILNDRPVYLLDKQADVQNTDFALLYFTKETAAECQTILHAFETGAEPSGAFTRGLAFRGVE